MLVVWVFSLRSKKEWGKPMTHKKRVLSKEIMGIVLVLVLVGMLEAGAGYTMLERYYKRTEEMEKTISDIYLSEFDQNFSQINIGVRSILYDGKEIQRIAEAYQASAEYFNDVEEMKCVLAQNNSILELKETFVNMAANYGSRFNFFYYDTKYQRMVESGGSSYDVRKPFIEMVEQMIAEDTMIYTAGGRWFLIGDYICTVYKGPNGIGGAWARAADFAVDLLKLSPVECIGIDVYDNMRDYSLLYERQENGTLTYREAQKAEEFYYRMNHADFQCRFVIDTTGYEQVVLLPMIFLGLVIAYISIAGGALLYTKRNILTQVGAFYNNLIGHKDMDRFNENMGIMEFAEAGKVLNKQLEEIRRLKIDIYEEQINRQKVELDYAQLQIRPHFFINCLNIIHSMAQEGLTKEIQEIVVWTSRYLRYILKKGMDPVTVEMELEFTENYLKILECMYDREYQCRITCEEELEQTAIPPLIIQTFVENSIKHNMDMESGFWVDVTVKRQEAEGVAEGYMEIVISDNGTGFDEQTRERYNAGSFPDDDKGYHIGIRNAVARIRMLYGQNAKAEFLENDGGGAKAVIWIPLRGEEK